MSVTEEYITELREYFDIKIDLELEEYLLEKFESGSFPNCRFDKKLFKNISEVIEQYNAGNLNIKYENLSENFESLLQEYQSLDEKYRHALRILEEQGLTHLLYPEIKGTFPF